MPGPLLGQLVNFCAASRKFNFIPFNYFSPGDSISWIYGSETGVFLQTVLLTGTVNGTNPTFTVPVQYSNTLIVFKNGVLQLLNVMYTVSGQTVTFLPPFIPQPGDVLQAGVS